jgi:hypothetical protein
MRKEYVVSKCCQSSVTLAEGGMVCDLCGYYGCKVMFTNEYPDFVPYWKGVI